MKLGAHVSARMPFSEAINRAKEKGCECMQLFVNQPQRWNPIAIPETEIEKFIKLNKSYDINPILIHSIYLVNLASYNTYFYKASIDSLIDDMKKAKAIGACGVNFHVGSVIQLSQEEAYKKIKTAILQILDAVPDGPDLVLENSAGAGNVIGDKFEELGKIIKMVNSPRLKVTLDTAHAFESGYDIRTEEGLNKTLNEFEKEIGLDRLICLHLNDSMTSLGSNHDRHDNIGLGQIGMEAFRMIVNHSKLKNIPGIIETPELKGRSNINNLDVLKKLRQE